MERRFVKSLYKSFNDRLVAVVRSSTAGVARDAAGRSVKLGIDHFPDVVWLVNNGAEHITRNHVE
jgi:hypothetical protein